MQFSKDVLFFSNFCDYSKEIVNLLIKKNIKQNFVLICVDSSKYKLPDFVDRVPIIYTHNGEVLYDETIVKYIEAISPKNESILPFSLHQSANYSDNFSFLDDSDELSNKGYTMVGFDQRIMAAPDDDASDNSKNKFDTAVLDQYMQARDSDTQAFKKTMNNGESFVRF
jgi:hypothetical protein